MTRKQMMDRLIAAGMGEAQAQAAADVVFGKTVAFTKTDGTVRNVSEAQAQAWEKFRANAPDRKEAFEQMKADWQSAREGYKPSKELVDAIRKDRASVTRKVAVEKFGFVGTKADLKALKERILG